MPTGLYQKAKEQSAQVRIGSVKNINPAYQETPPRANILSGIAKTALGVAAAPFTSAYDFGQTFAGTREAKRVQSYILSSEARASAMANKTRVSLLKKYSEGKITKSQLQKYLSSPEATHGLDELLNIMPTKTQVVATGGLTALNVALLGRGSTSIGGLSKASKGALSILAMKQSPKVLAKTLEAQAAKGASKLAVRGAISAPAIGMVYGGTQPLTQQGVTKEDVAKGILMGGVLGGGLYGVAKGIPKGISKIQNKARAKLTSIIQEQNKLKPKTTQPTVGGKTSGLATPEEQSLAIKEVQSFIDKNKSKFKLDIRETKKAQAELNYKAQQVYERAGGGTIGAEAKSKFLTGQRIRKSSLFTPLNISPETENTFNKLINEKLPYGESTGATKAINELMAGIRPSPSRLESLQSALNIDFTPMIHGSSAGGFLSRSVKYIGGILRASMASGDVSAIGRQAFPIVSLRMITNPIETSTMLAKSLKYWGLGKGEANLATRTEQIRNLPIYKIAMESKLDLTSTSGALARREEAFGSQPAERIWPLKYLVRPSDRQFTGVLNDIRVAEFTKYSNKIDKIHNGVLKDIAAQGLSQSGKAKAIKEAFAYRDELRKAAAILANTGTGRGQLKVLRKSADLLNATLFSPKLMSSRLAYFNPKFYMSLPKPIRAEAYKQVAGMVMVATGMLGLAKAIGADVELDPRSSDFGKAKFGNTRLEMAGGFTPYMRSFAQFITGTAKSTTMGKVASTSGFGKGGRLGTAINFGRGKLNPLVGTTVNIMTGTTPVGQQVTARQTISNFAPMLFNDVWDTLHEDDKALLKALLVGTAGALGAATNTYGSPQYNARQKAETQYANRLKKSSTMGEKIRFRTLGMPKK